VGLTADSSCAAIRAKISNPTQTGFIDPAGEWIMGHNVALEDPARGLSKLANIAAMAVEECLGDIARERWPDIPFILCVAEPTRPGRLAGLDDHLIEEIQQRLGTRFAAGSTTIAGGRVGFAHAVLRARSLIEARLGSMVIVVGTDSLLNWPTLGAYEREQKLLTADNSNGFMPGEGAGALLLGVVAEAGSLSVCGLGFSNEPATVNSGKPLRGDGIVGAIRAALAEADCSLHELDLRIADLSGEQYYFKEATLGLSRLLRVCKEEFDIWHPAECIGEVGAVNGFAMLALADAACRKAYAPGTGILCHASNDGGQRAAAVLRYLVA
jgi:3-oxoacyl-[acyl-carrier-protein] synthase-1